MDITPLPRPPPPRVVALSRPLLLKHQGDDRLYLRPPRAPCDLVQLAVELVGLAERAPLRKVRRQGRRLHHNPNR